MVVSYVQFIRKEAALMARQALNSMMMMCKDMCMCMCLSLSCVCRQS